MLVRVNDTLRDIHVALKYIFNAMVRPLWVDPTTSRVKTDTAITGGTLGAVTTVTGVATVTSVSAVTTVGAVTTVTNLGTANVSGQYLDRLAWANAVRPRIT